MYPHASLWSLYFSFPCLFVALRGLSKSHDTVLFLSLLSARGSKSVLYYPIIPCITDGIAYTAPRMHSLCLKHTPLHSARLTAHSSHTIPHPVNPFYRAAGRSEAPAYAIAQRAAQDSGGFLMAHHAISTVGLDACPGRMRAGDIYTHMYHGWPSTVLEVRAGHAAVTEND